MVDISHLHFRNMPRKTVHFSSLRILFDIMLFPENCPMYPGGRDNNGLLKRRFRIGSIAYLFPSSPPWSKWVDFIKGGYHFIRILTLDILYKKI